MSEKLFWAGLVLAMVLVVLAAGMVWNEARKEIVFLCGNFSAGVTEESVIRQLETGHFLDYRYEKDSGGERIVADTEYTFGAHACVIELGPDRKVDRAVME